MLLNSQTLCFEWLRSKKGKIKPSTYDKYDMILNKYLLDFFNNYHLDQLDISIIKDYFISLLDQGLSSSVVQSIKNVLKAIYITYENQYGLNHIDFSLVKIEQDKKENEYLTDKQFNQLHQYCMKEKNDIFIDNTNLQGRMSVFHDKLRKHLSNEYLFFVKMFIYL